MPIEVEIKLRLPDGRIARKIMDDEKISDCRMTPFTVIEMRSAYYDTPAGELSARKWALRVRLENGVPVAAFKTDGKQDAGFFTRGEWQVPAASLEEAIPALVSAGAPRELSLLGPFEQVCCVEFTRNAAHLRLEDGSVAELAVDIGRLIADEKSAPLCELELELLAGQPDAMTAMAGWLESRYDLTREVSSKYDRALRLVRSRQ